MKLWLLNVLAQFFSLWPQAVQKRLYSSSPWVNQPMRFDVIPGSCWVGYDIRNKTMIERVIPEDLELTDIVVMEGLPPKPMLFFNFFGVDSDFLKGNRLEIVSLVREKHTGKKRFIILDYLSDTISSDPYSPFKRPNCRSMSLLKGREYCAKPLYHLEGWMLPKTVHLSQGFAVEANERIYYGHPSKEWRRPNVLAFDPHETLKARAFKIHDISNHLWKEARSAHPSVAFYYPNRIRFTIIPESRNVDSSESSSKRRCGADDDHHLFRFMLMDL